MSDFLGHAITFSQVAEELLECDGRVGCESTRTEQRVTAAHIGERNTGGLSLRAPDSAAAAGATFEVDWQVAAEASGLRVLPTQQAALRHRSASDSCPERNHNHVITALRRAGIPFPEQCEAGIILDFQGNAQLRPTPRNQIQSRSVIELSICRKDAALGVIHKTAKTDDHSGWIGSTSIMREGLERIGQIG
jgi:hypothetical protein